MREVQVFISYRRDDSAGYARALYDALARRYGAERVFIDVDDIGAGQAFADVIHRAVGASDVLLVLIGQRWRGERPGQPPRLDDGSDFVRLEVSAALAGDMHVIPVLLDGAAMPAEVQLPLPLRALAGRHALELRNTSFAADRDRLMAALDGRLAGQAAAAPAARPAATVARRPALVVGVSIALAALAGTAALWLYRAPVSPAASASPTRPAIDGAWQAAVEYDWPNARYTERFVFSGSGRELIGSASFLSVPRSVLEGSVEPDGLRFVTRTAETSGAADAARETVHRYRGRLVGGELRFSMQTEGGTSAHVPVEFVARRAAALASQAGR